MQLSSRTQLTNLLKAHGFAVAAKELVPCNEPLALVAWQQFLCTGRFLALDGNYTYAAKTLSPPNSAWTRETKPLAPAPQPPANKHRKPA